MMMSKVSEMMLTCSSELMFKWIAWHFEFIFEKCNSSVERHLTFALSFFFSFPTMFFCQVDDFLLHFFVGYFHSFHNASFGAFCTINWFDFVK